MQAANAVIGNICAREPWTFLEKTSSPTIATQELTLPSDFRAVLSLIIPALGVVLQPERLDTTVKNYSASLTLPGVPAQYYFVGNHLYVRPVPATTYTTGLYYLCNHPTVTAASLEVDLLIPAAHHQVIVDGTLARLYAMEDDPDNSNLFTGFFERGIQQMAGTWKRQYDLPDRVVDVWENGDGWY